MLEEFNDHPVWRTDICKASAGKFPWLCENLGTALANAFHGLVHILDVQTEVSNAGKSHLDTPPERAARCLADKVQELTQTAETQEISYAAIGPVRRAERLRFEDVHIKTHAGIGIQAVDVDMVQSVDLIVENLRRQAD